MFTCLPCILLDNTSTEQHSVLLLHFLTPSLSLSLYHSIYSDIYWNLLIGRGLAGIAIGIIHFLVPLYIDEIATAEQKRTFNSITQMQFVLGILSQFVLGE